MFDHPVVELTQSSNGRLSGKSWKSPKSAAVRSHLPPGVRTKKWQDRMKKIKEAEAITKLQQELKDEKQAEIRGRREVTLMRKKQAEENHRLAEAKAQMGTRRAARLRRKAGRTKKINH